MEAGGDAEADHDKGAAGETNQVLMSRPRQHRVSRHQGMVFVRGWILELAVQQGRAEGFDVRSGFATGAGMIQSLQCGPVMLAGHRLGG
jgi:hypothetical protein